MYEGGRAMFQKNDPSFMDNVQKKTNVRPDQLFKLANSVSHANLQDSYNDSKVLKSMPNRLPTIMWIP